MQIEIIVLFADRRKIRAMFLRRAAAATPGTFRPGGPTPTKHESEWNEGGCVEKTTCCKAIIT